MPEPSKRARPDDKSGSERHHQSKKQRKDPARAKYRAQVAQAAQTRTLPHEASSSSWPRHHRHVFLNEAIQSGDVGIFVTSDRGKERAALREADDLISHYLERHHGPGEQREHGKAGAATDVDDDVTKIDTNANANANANPVAQPTEIEDQIAAELAELDDGGSSTTNLSKLDLITLDIPCVSFVRLRQPPPSSSSSSSSTSDPVQITLSLLRSAASSDATTPRSRFIKRLTPIRRFRKILNGGLDDLCAEILPVHFATTTTTSTSTDKENHEDNNNNNNNEVATVKFRIDLTRRQSEHLSREATIAATAGWVQKQRLTSGSPGTTTTTTTAAAAAAPASHGHKVDLKHWDKLIVVEAYRGLIGMSVIDVGYQEWDGPLKRGNLAEVYAAAAMTTATAITRATAQ